MAHASTPDSSNRIRPAATNPRYWQYQGKPVLLLGASDTDNLFQWPNLEQHLDRLVAAGGNVVRNTMSDRDPGDERAFAMSPDGRYDLTQWNPLYWQRLETMLQQTHQRGIVVQLELWDRFDHSQEFWESDPYNPRNNCTYSAESSGLATAYPNHPNRNEQPFFFTVPALQDNRVVRPVQEAFIAKVLSHTLAYDHVLYCIDNESNGAQEWALYWMEFCREQAKAAGTTIAITQMWDAWELDDEQHRRTLDHPERFDYGDLSQNAWQCGESNWTNGQWAWHYIAKQPRPLNSTKIYGSTTLAQRRPTHDTDHALDCFWRAIVGGFASARFHRPEAGQGLNDRSALQLRAARKLLARYDIFRSIPDSAHTLLTGRSPDGAYAASIAKTAWIVFFPRGGSATLATNSGKAALRMAWLNTATAAWCGPQQCRGNTIALQTPGPGRWVALVER